MPESNFIAQLFTGMVEKHPMDMEDGDYDFALNAEIEGFDGNGLPIFQNVLSNKLCLNFPEGYVDISFANIIEQNRILWFLYNPTTGKSEIGETLTYNCEQYKENDVFSGLCDNCSSIVVENTPLEKTVQVPCCTYKKIAGDDCLNFSNKFPITAVQYFIDTCSLKVFFTDPLNSFRHIEFDYVDNDPTKNLIIKKQYYKITGFSDDDCKEAIYSTDLNCDRLQVFANKKIPTIDFIDLVSGGSNKAGTYQFLISFADKDSNSLSNYFFATNPIPIFTKYLSFETDYVTDRAIALKINNLDVFGIYDFYNLLVVKDINNSKSFYLAGTFPISKSSVVYTGNNETEIKLTEGDIFKKLPFYKSVNGISISNDILFLNGLTEYKKLNLQQVANKIKLQWQTIAIPEQVYRDARNVNKYRSSMRDEVYPYAGVFVFDNGEESSAFHIPGREAIPSDLDLINNSDVFAETNCTECGGLVSNPQIVIDPGDLNLDNPPIDDSGDTPESNAHQSSDCSGEVAVSNSPTSPFYSGTGLEPVVDAGPDFTVTTPGVASLKGTFFVNTTVSYRIQWNEVSGPTQVVFNPNNNAVTSFTSYDTGTYVFELVIFDSDGNFGVDSVTVTIDLPANIPPISDPGVNRAISLPTTSSYLNGSLSSDSDGQIVSFLWEFVSGPHTPTIVNSTSVYTDITGLTVIGNYVFKLTVTDDRGCFSEATITITVTADLSTVIPTCVALLYPVNGSKVYTTNNVVLQWNTSINATQYNVYIWKAVDSIPGSPTAVVSVNSYIASGLLNNTIYNWYIAPKNTAGTASGCAAYYKSFVTPSIGEFTNCDNNRWKVYNTGSLVGGSLEVYKQCEETCYQYGEFAYWESIETYPNIPEVWGDLCGKPIRHHKFPDSLITHIHDNQNGSLDFNKSNVVYPIGVKVDFDSIRSSIKDAVTNGIISQADANRIVGFRLVRGDRFRNKSIIAKGLIFDVNQYQRKKDGGNFDEQPIYFANYPYNDVRSNPFITDDFANYDDHNDPKGLDLPFTFSGRYTFHSPDTHFNQPFSASEIKLETVEYGEAEGFYNVCKDHAKQKLLSDASYGFAFTGGILEMILKTSPQDITNYTVKGSIISAMGVASGELGPFLPYEAGAGAAITGNSALDAIVNPTKSGAIFAATDATVRTIQGKRSDYFNPIYLAVRKPYLIPLYPLLALNIITDSLRIILEETNLIIDAIKNFTPYRDWGIQYNSVGKYNAYKTVANSGNKQRRLLAFNYLNGENTNVNEVSDDLTQSNTIKFNNWNRESSLYLKYSGVLFPNASSASSIQDVSRVPVDNLPECNLNKKVYTGISSYYASLKNNVPDQYGTIYDIEYLSTGSEVYDINTSNTTCLTIFGGDTFINRFALKTKVQYFLSSLFKFPSGTDMNFSEYPNLAVPRHYFDTNLSIGSNIENFGDVLSLFNPTQLGTFLGRPKSIRDCQTSKLFYQNGYIYYYHYGIPYFFVESDINVDYRYAENSKEGDFYPHNQNIEDWLQEFNVPISEDNTYTYNKTYSKQNEENSFVIDGPDYIPSEYCENNHDNRIIYSDDPTWSVFKADNVWDVPLSKGKLISLEGIENQTVLLRTTNGTEAFKAVIRIPISGQDAIVGNGGIFANPPEEFAETKIGFVGTQHKVIAHTLNGHISIDAKRGQIFNIGYNFGSLDILSQSKEHWFAENLPFKILKAFPNMPLEDADNPVIGIGLSIGFDKKYNRIFVTKLDYEPIVNTMLYDNLSKDFYIISNNQRQIVNLEDSKYFKNCSWTISYNFKRKGWTSYHSFLPKFYMDFASSFGIIQDDAFWMHNVLNNSYQVYCGKLFPFIVEGVFKFEGQLRELHSMQFDTEVRRYENSYDFAVLSDVPGFNKAILYNNNYNSGLLNLNKVNKNNLSNIGKYPKRNYDGWEIELAASNYKWNFNQFYNLLRDNTMRHWTFRGNNAEKDLNLKAFDYKKNDSKLYRLKGQWFKARLINDQLSNFRILFKFSLSTQNTLFK